MRTLACRCRYLYSVSAGTRFINVGGMSLAVSAVYRSCFVACWAFPHDRLSIVPSALPLDSRVHGAVFAGTVAAGRTSHATRRSSLGLYRWIIGTGANVDVGVRVERDLLLQGYDAVHYSVAHSRRIMPELFQLLARRVGMAVLSIALHPAQ